MSFAQSYYSVLVLCKNIQEEKLKTLTRVHEMLIEVDVAKATLESLIEQKRSNDIRIQKMITAGIDANSAIQESNQIAKFISHAAVNYTKAKIEVEKSIRPFL